MEELINSISCELLSATQKSWRGLGSEATACHEITARIAVKRRKHEEEKEAIFLFEKLVLASLSFVCLVSLQWWLILYLGRRHGYI